MVTPEEADAALDQAIHNVAAARGDIRDGGVLTGWVVVGIWQRAEDDGETDYTLAFPGGSMPTHIGVGLLDVGRDLLLHGEREDS